MRTPLAPLAILGLALALDGCTLIDVRTAPHGGVHSDAFISGYADAGWPASDSLLKVGLFDGPSRGSIVSLQIWKLLRFELGFVGLALGVGPLDAGVGVLLYEPRPPRYVDSGRSHQRDDRDDRDEGDGDRDEEEQPGRTGGPGGAAGGGPPAHDPG